MSISLTGTSSVANGTSSLSLTYPTVNAGDLIAVVVVNKPDSAAPDAPTGYTATTPGYDYQIEVGGAGSAGADTGNVSTTVFIREADGTESGSLPVTITGANSSIGAILVFDNAGSWSWDAQGGADNSAGASWSVTTSTFSTSTNDMLVAFSGINTDGCTFASQAISQTGVTFGAATEILDTGTTQGDDCGLVVSRHTATAGSASGVAATYTMTATGAGGSSGAGSSIILRLREIAVVEPIGPPGDVTVGVGFGYDPFSSSPTYTDVTAYIDATAGIDITRGRSEMLDQPDAGTCTFVLNNYDGRFTPGYTSGPYGSNVKVRAPIQVTISYGGTDYTRFTGFVQSWELFWPGGVTESSKVRVTCTDLLGILADTPTRVPISDTMLHTDPVALYPLTERQRPAFDVGDYDQDRLRFMDRGGPAGTVDMGRKDGEFPSAPRMPTVYVKAGTVDADDRMAWAGLAGTVDFQSASTYLGFGGWIKWDVDSLDTNGYIASLELNTTYSLLIWQHPDYGLCCGSNSDRTTAPTIAVSGGQITDGKWHFVYAVYEKSTYKMTLVVDNTTVGYSATGLGLASGVMASSGKLVVGGADYPASLPTYTAMPAGWLSHWGVWTDAAASGLDTGEIWTEGRRRERPDSLSSQRVSWLLDKVGWPTADRNIETGVTTVPSETVTRDTALSYIQSCADAEVGVVYVKRNGQAAFSARPHRYAATTSKGTLSWHEVGQSWVTDVDSVRNIVNVSFVADGGGSVRLRDKASQTAYGHREQVLAGGLLNGHEAHGAAEYVLGLLSTPTPRMSPFEWSLLTHPTQADNELVLDLDLNDRFTVSSIPSPAHTSSADFWVEQLQEHIGIDDWTVTITTTPWVELFPSGAFVLGSNTLDTDTYLSY